jgi:hypothetical protein
MTEKESINLEEEDLYGKLMINPFYIQLIYLNTNGDKKFIEIRVKNKRILG